MDQNQLVITREKHMIFTAWIESGRVCQLQIEDAAGEEVLNNIYVGKVRNVVKNINAAFVEFEKGKKGYLPLKDCIPVHTGGVAQDPNRVLIGDEIIVQVKKEALKKKPPALSGNLELAGKYIILSSGKETVCLSRKIQDKAVRKRLQEFLTPLCGGYGILARTNSAQASEEELVGEIVSLKLQIREIIKNGMHKAPFTCLYQAPPAYLGSIRDMYQSRVKEVVTDDAAIYDAVCRYLAGQKWQDKISAVHWKPDQGKLDAVYHLSASLNKALLEKVWLKSGAYLIIQPTEALVSIDVNTGKSVSGRRDYEQHFKKVNIEAAKEIAIQLRLRNLSGIILVDFIDMDSAEAQEELMEVFHNELDKDPVPAKLVDMTKLGLVEVTRKKVRKSLTEQYIQATSGRGL